MARLPSGSGVVYYRPHAPHPRRTLLVTDPSAPPPDGRDVPTAPDDDTFRDTIAAALAPSYQLGRELTGGGMSRVFVAEEPALGRTVVLKVLPPELAAGLSVERFRREMQFAARLQHPHIVPLLSAGVINVGDAHEGRAAHEGLPYYTMPFIEGESVRAALARGRRFTVREVVRVLHDVVEALAYAHARGVIHRDIKPGNVLMLGNHALVTDFGVAKALSAARQSPEARGGGGGGAAFAAGTTSTGLAIGTPAGAVLGGDTPPGAAVPAQAGMTAPLGTMPLGTMPLGTPAAAVTTPLAAPNAVDQTVGVRAPHAATRRRPTAVLGGALLG